MSNPSSPKSLSSLDGTFGWKAPGSQVDLRDILLQLQGFRVSYAVGGNQSAALSLRTKGGLTGSAAKVTTSDVILGAINFTVVAASGLADISFRNDCRIRSTGNIQFSGGATTGQHAIIFWWDTSGYVGNV